jgi:Reverse transcriptase (RNA-dependent DNA polymerase)
MVRDFTKELSKIQIPNSVDKAVRDPKWVEAMEIEIEALKNTQTWKLVKLPNGNKTIGCKWVFSMKYDATGKVERYKARLVVKGYTQTYGIDFQETFSPVTKLNTVWVLLSLTANQDWSLHQFDVNNVFLYGDLEEEIYMDIPPGYTHQKQEKLVCKMERSLYGLKQSPWAWFGRFCKAMKKYNYTQSDFDHTLFYKHRQDKVTILIIYVDDMIITGDDSEEIRWLEQRLSKEFEMKTLGGLKYFLGIEVLRSTKDISLPQRKYTLDLLAEMGMIDCKPVDTPVIQNLKLKGSPDDPTIDKEAY